MLNFLSIAALSVLAAGQVVTFVIAPSTTDPAIHNFDEPHHMYVDRAIIVDHDPGLPQDRHELLLWLTGTGGKADEARAERVLYTAYPSVTITGNMSQAAKTAHNSAISGFNADRWKQVWTYLLTEKSD